MRYLIVLELTETGFAVQVPDLAVVTYGASVSEARKAAVAAIEANLGAYREAGQEVPERQSVISHLENSDFRDLLFTYVQISESHSKIAA